LMDWAASAKALTRFTRVSSWIASPTELLY
jgi:hypothetical protein